MLGSGRWSSAVLSALKPVRGGPGFSPWSLQSGSVPRVSHQSQLVTGTIINSLTSGIPQSQLDVLAINFDIRNMVLENGRDVYLNLTVKLRRFKLQENQNLGECALGKDHQDAGQSKGQSSQLSKTTHGLPGIT